MSKLTDSQEWKALEAHAEVAKTWHMKELFAKDPANGLLRLEVPKKEKVMPKTIKIN